MKKEEQIEYVNKDCFESHKEIIVRMQMSETRSFYRDKKHQIRLWQAIGSDEAIAFRFGTREHGNLDRLLEPLKLLDAGNVYADGNYAYYERFSPEVLTVTKRNTQKYRKETSVSPNLKCRLVRKGLEFSKTTQTRKTVVALAINV
jgi:IS1 family transposase